MPELPEVETVRRGLAVHLPGARLLSLKAHRENLRVPLPLNLDSILRGRILERIERRAKYLLLHFTGGQVLIAHLGMSGKLLLNKGSPAVRQKHDHVVFTWSNGYTLTFNDPRRFGLILLSEAESLATHSLLKELGPEPLEKTWNADHLHTILKASESSVKAVIMDQRKLVGVGNIYACEALFRAGIRPTKPANKVTRTRAEKLATAIRDVLEEAIESGGSTLRDYVRSSGDSGYFQHHFRVYGRGGLPCLQCETPIKVTRQGGRSTFYCPRCQK